MRELKLEERLIVAADFKPGDAPDSSNRLSWARGQVLKLADSLAETGVVLKMNSVLRACGYSLICEVHDRGLKVFADLKLFDISETLTSDAEFLAEFDPELLTVAPTGVKSMMAVKKKSRPTTVSLGVTVLTTLNDADAQNMYGYTVDSSTLRLANLACGKGGAGLDGLICSPKEAEKIRSLFGPDISIVTPGVRFDDEKVVGDDQNQDRVMTPARAIQAGANRIVMGRPITQAENPVDAAKRALDEMSAVL